MGFSFDQRTSNIIEASWLPRWRHSCFLFCPLKHLENVCFSTCWAVCILRVMLLACLFFFFLTTLLHSVGCTLLNSENERLNKGACGPEKKKEKETGNNKTTWRSNLGFLGAPQRGREQIWDGDFLGGPVVKNCLPMQRTWFYLCSGKFHLPRGS